MTVIVSPFDWLVQLVSASAWTYALVAGATVLDAVLPLVPSETVLITAAIGAAAGNLSVALIIVSAAMGGILGDNISYLLGDTIGEPAYRRLFSGHRAQERFEWARRILEGHGIWLVPAARFVPGGRTAVTFAAGTVGMMWPKFFLVDAAAAVAWAIYGGMVGYLGGAEFRTHRWAGFVLAFGVAAVITLAGLAYYRYSAGRGP